MKKINEADGVSVAPTPQYDVRPFDQLPADHVQRVEGWLNSNEKRPADVRWSLYPIGMVQRWIERALSAESVAPTPAIDERAQFEKWCKREFGRVGEWYDEKNRYFNGDTQIRWEAWQARASVAKEGK